MTKEKCAFDVLVDGTYVHHWSMPEQMDQYVRHKKLKEWEKAKAILEYAAECSYLPAEIELANLYKTTPELNIPHSERYRKAEHIYHKVLNILDLSDGMTAKIALELADLYGNYMKQPIGGLAMLLCAKRLGKTVPERTLETCRRQIAQMDIHDFGKDTWSAFTLASELLLLGTADRFVELLLRECVESHNQSLRGRAALSLADFYNDRQAECAAYRKEAEHYYRIACENGFPEYLRAK